MPRPVPADRLCKWPVGRSRLPDHESVIVDGQGPAAGAIVERAQVGRTSVAIPAHGVGVAGWVCGGEESDNLASVIQRRRRPGWPARQRPKMVQPSPGIPQHGFARHGAHDDVVVVDSVRDTRGPC